MSARLEAAIMKAISLRREDRFADAEELIYQLETGSPDASSRRSSRPLLNRNPVLFWKSVSVFLLVVVIVEFLLKR
jgi:hypothetical protein